MVRFFKAREAILPKNFHVIYSFGGTQDHLINAQQDRHSNVFDSLDSLKAAQYVDTFKSDYAAFKGEKRIGLVYHGHASSAWVTA
jgi:hypothetical protein